jgi:alkylation response protein AidB-like acyl-CoA dehydrogenase
VSTAPVGDFIGVDEGLSAEERAVRDTVRDFARTELAPYVAEWYERGTLPTGSRAGLRKAGPARCAPGRLRLRRRERHC